MITRALFALHGGSESQTDSVRQSSCATKMGQKKEKQIMDLTSVCNPLKKRGVPLRIYEMVRWEDTLLGLVRKEKCASII